MGQETRSLSKVVDLLKKRVELVVKRNRNLVSMVYVDDVVESVLQIMTADRAVHEVFYCAHPKYMSVKELNSLIKHALGIRFVLKVPVPVFLAKAVAAVFTFFSRVTKKPHIFNSEKVYELTENWVCSPNKLTSYTKMQFKTDFHDGIHLTLGTEPCDHHRH